MSKASYLIPRRTFLRGLGASLALPALEIMSPALSYGKIAQAKKPLRLAILFKGAGVNPSSWDIHGGSETQFDLSPLLSPLEKNKSDIVILRNLQGSGRGGGHESATVNFMTGQLRKSRLIQRQSFDQVIADHVGNQTPVKSLQMRSDTYLDGNDPAENFLSYDADGHPMPVEDKPEVVFNQLFKGFHNSHFRQRTSSVLDDVKESYKAIARKASRQDQQILEQYLQSVREVERDIGQFTTQVNTSRDKKLSQIKPIPAANNLAERTRAMLDLTALAFWTDMTRVSTLMMAHTESRSTFEFLGINDELHMLSHFVRTRNRSGGLGGYDRINLWYVQQFSKFIERLKELPDAEGSVLDNSAILFGSGIKHGDYHSVTDLPLVLAGGGGGQILPGRHVEYPTVPNSNLHLKLMDIMGVKREQYGNSSGILTGISEKANLTPHYQDDGSWKILSDSNNKITLKGFLKISVKADDLNLYLVQLSNKQDLEIRPSFGNVHGLRFDSLVGSVVSLEGVYTLKDGKKIITKVNSAKRL
jgi:hypothetical protein